MPPLLRAQNLQAFYGELQVLFGVNFEVKEGEIVSLLGRNGAGKTSCLKAALGLLSNRSADELTFRGQDLLSSNPRQIARLGLGYCPDDRGIFASLSVEENLLIAPKLFPDALTIAGVYELFPRLKERAHLPGKKISGGEQQMLAIGRLLMTGSKFLILDEPTEGLAPLVIRELADFILKLKSQSYSILLVEQNQRFAEFVADRHYLMERGQMVNHFDKRDFSKHQKQIENILGLSSTP